jgi:hydroxypyruvate isomerase
VALRLKTGNLPIVAARLPIPAIPFEPVQQEQVLVRFCANISMLFTEHPFLDRFAAAHLAGFDAVEIQFPYDVPAGEIKARLNANGLDLELFNLPAGDFARGDRGMACEPGRETDFRTSLDRALDYATVLNPRKLNCLAGKRKQEFSQQAQTEVLVANLRLAAERTQAAGIKLVTEPLNPYDGPGFFLPTPSSGFAVINAVNHPNLGLQYDIYHAQRTEGNIVTTLAEHRPAIGHIQIADAPDRNEPGTGELNWRFIFAELDRLGFTDYIGLEYRPSTADTAASLAWMEEYIS